MVTPDAQRTMYTSLGAAITLTPEDVDEEMIATAEVLLLEGYLFDVPEAAEACQYALELAAKHGTKRALTLADSGCVERHQAAFQEMVNNHLDIVFANELEAQALSGLSTTDEAVRWAAQVPALVVVTRSEKGSLVIDGGDPVKVDAVMPERLEDTTGAGDLYAAGFLYGLTHGFDHARCGHLGGLLAAETISHIGARPQSDISLLVAKAAA
jgi:sugar/nucleoside kinase (ribokinase family)